MAKESEVKIVINADDKASKVIKGLNEALGKTVETIQALTDNYTEYGDQVHDMASFTRMGAEETSRLIQVADDAFVEYDSLKMAMRYMADQGIKPSIENLAQLSDQFTSMQDPLQQTQFLMDTFGSRSGEQMAKLMQLTGDGIRQMSADVSSSLILDQQKLDAINANKVAVDNFNDAIEGMRYDAAGQLLGIFQQMPGPIQNASLALGGFVSSGTLDALSDMAITMNVIGNAAPGLTNVGTAVKGIAVATWAAVGPILAVAAAVVAVSAAVYKLIEFIRNLVGMLQQAAANGLLWQFLSRTFNFYELGKNIDFSDLTRAFPGRASGGPVTAGRPYIVGEERPEVFVPGSNGTILPNIPAGGGGTTVVLNYSPMFSMGDRESLARDLEPMFDEWLRRRR